MTDTGFVRIKARQQRSAAGATSRIVIELGESNSVGSKSIEIGCLNLSAVTAKVGKAHVIREDDYDVRPFGGSSEDRNRTQEDTGKQQHFFHAAPKSLAAISCEIQFFRLVPSSCVAKFEQMKSRALVGLLVLLAVLT